jgi:hypothetical protein
MIPDWLQTSTGRDGFYNMHKGTPANSDLCKAYADDPEMTVREVTEALGVSEETIFF